MPDRDALARLSESRERLAGLAGLAGLARFAGLTGLTTGTARCAAGTACPACAGRPAHAGRTAIATVTAIAAVATGPALATCTAVAAGSTLAAVTARRIEVRRAADRVDVIDHVAAGHGCGRQRDHRRSQKHTRDRAESSHMTKLSQPVARLAISLRAKAISHLLTSC
jgi:hypothetical protein